MNETTTIIPAPAAAPRKVLVPVPEPATAMQPYQPCPGLSQALAAARDRCKAAAKDARNSHHNYTYASADEIVRTASEALSGSGLALVPVRQRLNTLTAGNAVYFSLDRSLLITHASGEYLPLELEGWPVIPEKGRPLDKAYATALTSSLSYLLRDLLQMPRGEEHDMSARDDRPAPLTQPPIHAPVPTPSVNGGPGPNEPAPAKSEASPAITQEQYDSLVVLARQHQRTTQEVSAMLAAVGCKVLQQLPQSLLSWASAILTSGPASTQQVDQIASLVEQRKFSWEVIASRLQSKYGVDRVRMLTRSQADEVITLLTPKAA